MNEIRELDQITVDKIAAGEVVERPAGAVKELVENALDSGATLITIEIQNGGIDMIRVTDNGSGIPVSEVRKAFTRHATSKIRSIDDLSSLNSLGFRGEALSSIAAVSRVEMITKTADTITGTRYVMEGGAEVACEETGAPDGTTVVVHDLFYNTPARAKFLKTPKTEASYVAEFAECFALAHPECAFTFISDKKDRFHTSGNGDQGRFGCRLGDMYTCGTSLYRKEHLSDSAHLAEEQVCLQDKARTVDTHNQILYAQGLSFLLKGHDRRAAPVFKG